MTSKAGLRTRLRYWFDNTMSRGTPALIGWLAIVSVMLIVVISAALAVTGGANIFGLFWQTFISAFDLAIPDNATVAARVPWFVLALGGIFLVSALIGLINNGIDKKLEELRKGRSAVIERDHTVILGWSDQVFTVVSELVASAFPAQPTLASSAVPVILSTSPTSSSSTSTHHGQSSS